MSTKIVNRSCKDNSGSVLTVDPGRNTGWAFWTKGEKLPIVGWYKAKGIDKMGCEEYVGSSVKRFSELLRAYIPETVVIEGVELWGGSLKSQTSASQGNLFALAYMVGAYFSTAWAFPGVMVARIVPARIWKGQLTKEATQSRVHAMLGISHGYNEHEMDAVALGLSFLFPATWGR